MSIDPISGASVLKAAAAFGYSSNIERKKISNGLIHQTFLIKAAGKPPLLLQQVNTRVFGQPMDLQTNYEAVFSYLALNKIFLPALQKTANNKLLYKNDTGDYWRAFEYIENSFSPEHIQTNEDAFEVGDCFGRFTASLKDFPAQQLKSVLPRFHDLRFRFQQLRKGLRHPKKQVAGEVKYLLDDVMARVHLVHLYDRFSDDRLFPLHIMHHDCKVSNILFSRDTGKVICPVDLDTVMAGKFYSDLGDMIRTLCSTAGETSTDWNKIAINEERYFSVFNGYTNAVTDLFTDDEKNHLHAAGLLLIYMQCIRFLTDYVNGNIYYKTDYAEQNFHRAKNQMLLLKSLEGFLQKTVHYSSML